MEFLNAHILLPNTAPVLKQSFITSKPNKMNSEQIIKSDMLDILFENRNKMYGAYDLRKFYNDRLYKALGGMLAIVAVFTAFAFMSPKKKVVDVDVPGQKLVTVVSNIKDPEPPKETKPQAKQRVAQIPLLSTIKIVDNKTPVDTIRTLTPPVVIGSTYVAPGPGDPGPPLVGTVPGTGDPGPVDPGPVKEPEPAINPEEPIDNPDVEPQFPGGMQRLRTFLENNLSNPKDMEEGEKVRVVVKFVVGYDGKLKAFETVQDGGEEFNKEVMRVLKRMPAWIPGKAKGQNVSVFFTLPVVFTPAE
jgi:periplasmic protein TonB